MTVERFPTLGLRATLVPENEALQILEAWVNESPRSPILREMMDHWGVTVEYYPGWDQPDYVGPTYQVVRK